MAMRFIAVSLERADSVILNLPYGCHRERRYQRREPVAHRGTVVDADGMRKRTVGLRALSMGISEA